ncbi:DUF2089 family protein [Convivina intestini]|uniref:Uncharacterized protein DUF2089 n=1 Tax=Convivina intestini TaxID=1505726 RepID=A0A2U1DF28_9LACO|nr:DUF2089 family protein [Convivina intestini]PVY86179.1 uncharacterized protein DUF2089 [Convivina intestini]CAH1851392.1 hypothetical protein R077811_00319 [Convivina intestini]CAH1852863.1 hypothetical protein R078131_00556 [Convivina intestini]SDB81282.1 Protein of unknown function [Leuconostocaceae bacterium R-53105]
MWFWDLAEEDQEFIKQLTLASGSLKELAKIYGVSYPTVRLRLNRIIDKIRLTEKDTNNFESKIMQLVIDEKISLDIAKEIIEKYREEENV